MKIKQLQVNDNIEGYYLVLDKKMAETKTGSSYINMEVGDDSGKINAKIWDNAKEFDSLFKKGDIVKISAKVDKYKDILQFNIFNIRKASSVDDINLEEFLPKTKKSIDKMFKDLYDILSSVTNVDLKKLIDLFFNDKEFIVKFKNSIAAKSLHHNYIGGLLEHTLSVARICNFFAKHYEDLDRDLLVCIAFFHDIGKVKELNSITFDYSIEGGLKGHIVIGLEMLEEKFKLLDTFPSELKLRIQHAVISHHGELEWGAPIVPKTIESVVLHYADNVDAKTMFAFTELEKNAGSEDFFTPYNYSLKRSFYKGTRDEGRETKDEVRRTRDETRRTRGEGKKQEEFLF
ncbi:HD domain-containing protein [bacterium]|nr:HD domain-containing protein [bacterium]